MPNFPGSFEFYGLQKLCPRPLCFRFPFLSICCDKEKQHIEKRYWELGHSCEKPDYMVLVLLYCFWGQGDVGIFVCLLVLKEFDVRVLVAVQETVGMKFQISWRNHCISLKRRPMDTHPWPKKKIHFACFQWYQLKFEFSLFLSFFLPRHLALSPFFSFFLFPALAFRNGTRSAGMASDHSLHYLYHPATDLQKTSLWLFQGRGLSSYSAWKKYYFLCSLLFLNWILLPSLTFSEMKRINAKQEVVIMRNIVEKDINACE